MSETVINSGKAQGPSLLAKVRGLVGSGDKIGMVTLPLLAIGLVANIMRPEWFSVGGPPAWLRAMSIALLIPGVVMWIWSVVLILTKVPRDELITTGPFAIVKHPLYAAVSLLVLPWVGFLLNSWLGLAVGVVLYLASRRFAPAEEAQLAEYFGEEWDAYERSVAVPWL